MKVHVFNIKYRNNNSIWTITGFEALKNFIENNTVNTYNADTAPKQLDIDINLWGADPLQDLEFTEDLIKQQLKEETGLDVLSFNYRYNYS